MVQNINKICALFPIAIFISCCGYDPDNFSEIVKEPIKSKIIVQDPEFEEFTDAFESIFDVEVDYSVVFGSLERPRIGLCSKHYVGKKVTGREIIIDKDFWDTATYWEKMSIVFHEAGHCSLDLLHFEGYIEGSSCPISVMNPTVPSGYCMENLFYEYIMDMKGRVGE